VLTATLGLVQPAEPAGGKPKLLDVGAGTGIWTRLVAARGWSCDAVEPNDAMRAVGASQSEGLDVAFHAGSAEETGRADGAYDWVTMASSFHWADRAKALPEFRRVLRPGGFFTCVWNPRELAGDELLEGIEAEIRRIVPELKRRSSGKSVEDPEETLLEHGCFGDVIRIEAVETVPLAKERYLGLWRSVNDIRAQAGEERWAKIMAMIEERVADLDTIHAKYRTRSWTARRVD
jgi:SAM-dependent methyltransferase